MERKEYYDGILYILDETITVHRLGKLARTDTWNKDEKFLAYKQPKEGIIFKALSDGSELSLAVIRKLERGFKKPLFIAIGETK